MAALGTFKSRCYIFFSYLSLIFNGINFSWNEIHNKLDSSTFTPAYRKQLI